MLAKVDLHTLQDLLSKDPNLRIKLARSLATIVGHEDHVVHLLRLGIVVGNTVPVLARGVVLGTASSDNVVDVVDERVGEALDGSSRGLGGSGNSGSRGICLGTIVDLFPGDYIAVDGGGNPLGALLLDKLVEVLVAARVSLFQSGGDVALLLVLGREVVDGYFVDVDGTANVERELCIEFLVSFFFLSFSSFNVGFVGELWR